MASTGALAQSLFVVLGLDDLLATVETIRAYMVAQMRLASRGLGCQWRIG